MENNLSVFWSNIYEYVTSFLTTVEDKKETQPRRSERIANRLNKNKPN